MTMKKRKFATTLLTTAENSKLDLYLEAAEAEEESSFPVAYLRLW